MQAISPSTMIPQNLKAHLSEPNTPWHFSPSLFARITNQPWVTSQEGRPVYKKCEIHSEDPECAFILQYFNHQKPSRYGIGNIYCIHTPSLTTQFEGAIESIDVAAETFKPEWDKEDHPDIRAQVMERWKEQVNEFYPTTIQRPTREDTYCNVRVLPLWHGTSAPVCHSIASSGFTYFGKHHFSKPGAKAGAFKNTDPGYFGSGVYFTNSAQYAAMYNPSNLLMAWVCMKEPFPVINDVPHPQKGKDMKMLAGDGAYQTYNAHYIPVAPIRPNSMEYYPCYHTQAPACDEIVIFQKAQTLPRFWIELSIDFPTLLSPHHPIPGSFSIDLASLPTPISPGLSIVAKCSSDTCSEKNQHQWISLGLGRFQMSEVYYATACPSCSIDFDAVDHFILHHTTYSVKARDQQKNLTELEDQQIFSDQALMLTQFSRWKYLNLNLK